MKLIIKIHSKQHTDDRIIMQNLLLGSLSLSFIINGTPRRISATATYPLGDSPFAFNTSFLTEDDDDYPRTYEVDVVISSFSHYTKKNVVSAIEYIRQQHFYQDVSITKYKLDHFDQFLAEDNQLKNEENFFSENTTKIGSEHRMFGISNKKDIFHIKLMSELEPHFDKSNRAAQLSLENKNYSQALRRICTAGRDDITAEPLLKNILKYQKVLEIDLDEQAGTKKFSALHYAALRKNTNLYDLLIKFGASLDLQDTDGCIPSDYLDGKESLKAFHN